MWDDECGIEWIDVIIENGDEKKERIIEIDGGIIEYWIEIDRRIVNMSWEW